MNPLSRLQVPLADRYRIERELGAGGMATVYLARDLKHDRDVALKVLKPELRAVVGAERFLSEVRITAKLDHPHILTLIDSGESDDLVWYVLPFVRGESLRDRLNREKQLGIDDALAITRQVASALDYAHRHGVVHRDIKPENILLQEGEAMLADFGIALALREAGGQRVTQTGMSLGTPQYMSPEQATGERDPDSRSDIYSLGAVLYEMLAGEPPHNGPTIQAVIAKLMTEKPTPLRLVRDTVPPVVAAAVEKALAKTPADRFSTANAFAAALSTGEPPAAPAPTAHPQRRWQYAIGVVLLLGAAFGVLRLSQRPPPGPVLGRSDQFTTDAGLEIQPAISPDGKFVAYAAGTGIRMRIYLRPAGGGRTLTLTDDSATVETGPRWSPDGSTVLFLTHGGVSTVAALGGAARAVFPGSAEAPVRSATWSADGREIALVRRDSLLRIPLNGGQPRLIARTADLHSCDWSPTGQWIACVVRNEASVIPGVAFGNLSPSGIVLIPSGGGDLVPVTGLTEANLSPIWSRDGTRLFFISNRQGPRDIYSFAVSSNGRPQGDPVRLTTGLGAISLSLAADGKAMTYTVYSARANIWALPIPGRPPVTTERAQQVTTGNQVIESVSVSRDLKWLVYDSDLRGNADLYRLSIDGGSVEQLTNSPADEFAPDLSPDGRTVAYHTWRTGTRDIEVKPLNGGPAELVTNTPASESYPQWTRDGQALVFTDQIGPSILLTRRQAGTWMRPVVMIAHGTKARLSPDGREIAYVGPPIVGLTGVPTIAPASGGDGHPLVPPDLNSRVVGAVMWSPDGQTLYFKSHDSMGQTAIWSVARTGGRSRLLVRFERPDFQSNRADFATDGRRFFFPVEDRQSDVFVAQLVRQ